MADVGNGSEEVTFTRRFFGDNWLEGLLQALTLYIGWLVWFAIVAPRGQTPAKQLLHVRIHNYKTGEIASAGQVWMRDVVVKLLIPIAFAAVIVIATRNANLFNVVFALYIFAVGIALLVNDERRAFWDLLAGTVVRYHADGGASQMRSELGTDTNHVERRLRELQLLHSRGAITDDELQSRREQILSSI
jgi:uncharacterized RDD family membrane protein YckC